MKRLLVIFLAAGLIVCLGNIVSAQSLDLDKYNFKPMEEIKLKFEAGPGFASNAWIGIIPSNVVHGSEAENDKHDLTYQYLKNKASGVLTFKAPAKPGMYDFRMNTSDSNGKEAAHITFVVLGKDDAMLSLKKRVFKVNEEIKVEFKAGPGFASNAWIGLVPSHVAHGSETENDKHDLSYQYLKKRASGVLTFKAPTKPGKYDFRMHDTDSSGKEVTYISFEVK